jgi:hypothetical protein
MEHAPNANRTPHDICLRYTWEFQYPRTIPRSITANGHRPYGVVQSNTIILYCFEEIRTASWIAQQLCQSPMVGFRPGRMKAP